MQRIEQQEQTPSVLWNLRTVGGMSLGLFLGGLVGCSGSCAMDHVAEPRDALTPEVATTTTITQWSEWRDPSSDVPSIQLDYEHTETDTRLAGMLSGMSAGAVFGAIAVSAVGRSRR